MADEQLVKLISSNTDLINIRNATYTYYTYLYFIMYILINYTYTYVSQNIQISFQIFYLFIWQLNLTEKRNLYRLLM